MVKIHTTKPRYTVTNIFPGSLALCCIGGSTVWLRYWTWGFHEKTPASSQIINWITVLRSLSVNFFSKNDFLAGLTGHWLFLKKFFTLIWMTQWIRYYFSIPTLCSLCFYDVAIVVSKIKLPGNILKNIFQNCLPGTMYFWSARCTISALNSYLFK